MTKKLTNLFIITTITLLLLGSNISTTKAAEVPWNVGDTFKFGSRFMIEEFYIDYEHDEVKQHSIIDQISEYSINITSINNVTDTYEYMIYDVDGSTGPNPANYNADDFAAQITLANLFSGIDYAWDYEHNVTVLTSFGFTLPAEYLVYPNWSLINSKYDTILNASTILDTVADPYEPIIHNITLGQFLDEATSFSIQGKDTLAKAKELFTSTTTTWSFKFDLSGVMKAGVFNGTAGHNNYYPYEKLDFTFEVSCTDTGVINEYHQNYHVRVTVEDFLTEVIFLNDVWLGGIGETETSNFAYLMVLPGIGMIALFVKWISKKKK
ncbi:MAG: hypothetical protein FK734_20345 [Asgard group archaeon]|nr:hypothetical protein [Asgard group archaeon]